MGDRKDAQLVYHAFLKSDLPLNQIQISHTDRGSEFKNKTIESMLSTFNIDRSLSKAGCPYDNSVAESTYKALKTELINLRRFDTLEALETDVFDYVNWYNTKRLHGSLNYLPPKHYAILHSL